MIGGVICLGAKEQLTDSISEHTPEPNNVVSHNEGRGKKQWPYQNQPSQTRLNEVEKRQQTNECAGSRYSQSERGTSSIPSTRTTATRP